MIEDILINIEKNLKHGKLDTKIVEKVWGREIWLVNLDYCGKILEIKKGWCSSLHHHDVKDEVLFLYKGVLGMEHPNNNWIMYPGNCQRVSPSEKHRLTAFEDSRILEFSTHHMDEDSIRTEYSKNLTPGELKRVWKEFRHY